MQSSLPQNLTRVPSPQLQRSVFDRTHGYKTTFDEGFLIPFYIDEVLPGDTFNLRATLFARLATPIFPIMDNIYLDTQFFFVPTRLLWDNFKRFMGEQDNPTDSTSFLIPVFDRATYPALGFAENSLYDYMGLPTKSAAAPMTFDLQCLIPRMYNFVWNHWYRDENLQDSVPFNTGDGPDDYADYVLLRRGKRKDYFTGALPWPQKDFGSTPRIPLAESPTPIPVEYNSVANRGLMYNYTTGLPSGFDSALASDGTSAGQIYNVSGSGQLVYDPNGTLDAIMDNDMMGTINQLREAVQLQRFAERDARGGTRYTELVYSHFKVHTPDLFWRPEYLGGSSSRVNVHPVQQTGETGSTPQGNLAGFGTVLAEPRWNKSFNEHGYIIGLVSTRADQNYQQNVDRMWLRSTKFDFYWPEFAHLGEQAVLQTEILFDADRADYLEVFGYQERFAEYRYKPNTITGLFRSNATASLDAWHLAQELITPQLNDAFIQEFAPMSRVIAVPTEPHFIFDSVINLKCVRCMPVISVPGLMDHF